MLNKKLVLLLLTSLLLFLKSTLIFAAIAATDELLKLLDNMHAMQANFEQFAIDAKNKPLGQATSGVVTLQRPGKFRWDVHHPNQQMIIVNNDQMIIYDIDLAQVTKHKVNYSNPGNPALLLSGTAENLRKTFKVTKLPKSGVWFELKPKIKNNSYQWIKLNFVAEQLSAMYISDNLGQQSEIHFSEINLNPKLADEQFNFVPPKNVDVLTE